jgi:hypothetical protein
MTAPLPWWAGIAQWFSAGLRGLDDRGFETRQGLIIFVLTTAFRTALPPPHPASYPMGTRGSFPAGKAAGEWSWPLNSIYCRCVELYLHSHSTPPWRGAQLKKKAQGQILQGKVKVRVKVNLSMCFIFNWAPCHEGLLGEWRYSSTHSWPQQ